MKRILAGAGAALAGLVGLAGASRAGQGDGYALGLLLFAASVAFVFLVMRQHFDDPRGNRVADLWPETRQGRWAALIAFTVLALASLAAAAHGDRALYWAGLALAAVFVLAAFKAIGSLFDDNHDGRGRSGGGA